jgi:hypothetical protein
MVARNTHGAADASADVCPGPISYSSANRSRIAASSCMSAATRATNRSRSSMFVTIMQVWLTQPYNLKLNTRPDPRRARWPHSAKPAAVCYPSLHVPAPRASGKATRGSQARARRARKPSEIRAAAQKRRLAMEGLQWLDEQQQKSKPRLSRGRGSAGDAS